MSTQITPEIRSQIISSIKEGTTIAQAAETYGIMPRRIVDWMRKSEKSSKNAMSEVQKLKREVDFLKNVILDLVLEQKASIRKG
jgi:transposase-like protein